MLLRRQISLTQVLDLIGFVLLLVVVLVSSIILLAREDSIPVSEQA